MGKNKEKKSKQEPITPVTLDSAKVIAAMDRMSKLMGAPELFVLNVNKGDLSLSAAYAQGRVQVIDREAIVEKGSSFTVRISYAVLKQALKGRGKVTMTQENGALNIVGTRYRVALNVEAAQPEKIDRTVEEAIDVDALASVLSVASGELALWDSQADRSCDVRFSWGKEGIRASVATQVSAILVSSAKTSKKEGSLVLPYETASKLTAVGGKFVMSDMDIFAASEDVRLELRQMSEMFGGLAIKTVEELANRKKVWEFTVNCDELNSLLSSMETVTNNQQAVTMTVGKTALSFESRGHYGEVSGKIEYGNISGKPDQKRMMFNVQTLNSILSKFGGAIRVAMDGEGGIFSVRQEDVASKAKKSKKDDKKDSKEVDENFYITGLISRVNEE